MIKDWLARKYQRKLQKLSRNRARIVAKLQKRLSKGRDPAFSGKLTQEALHLLAPENRILPLAPYADQSAPVAELAPEAPFTSQAPSETGSEPERIAGTFPPVMARLFSDAEVCSVGSTIVTRDRITVPPLYIGRPELLITDGQFLLSQDGDMGTVFCPSPAGFERGIALFASGAANWYHWLIEILPWALLAEELPEEFRGYPLLVPEVCLAYPTFRDSLALFSRGRSVVALPQARPARIGRLVQIDSVSICPMNLIEGRWPVPGDFSQHAPVLRRFRAEIIGRLGLQPRPPTRRIFLARGHDRRSYNQPDLLDIAARHGFEAVYPERLTFREQVETFLSATAVVGPSGAAFANTLFCQEGTHGLSWLIPQYGGFCSYSNLAEVMGMELAFLFVEPDRPINSSFEGYGAGYTVDPDRFEAALQSIVTTPA